MFSILDVILVVLMLVSGILAMIRGFTREFLSIASWGAAALAVLIMLKYFPGYSSVLEPFIGHKLAAQAILSLILFIVILVIVHLVTIYISDRVLSSSIGALDHTMGFIFGLGRGLVAVVVLYLFFAALVTSQVHDSWVKSSRSLPLVRGTGEMIKSLLPADLAETISKKMEKGSYVEPPETGSGTGNKKTSGTDSNRGYQANERRGLNQLFESTGSTRN